MIEDRRDQPRRLTQEQIDHEKEMAANLEYDQIYTRHLNEACAAIRAAGVSVDNTFIAQVIYTLSATASKAGLDKVVDVLDEAVVEVE